MSRRNEPRIDLKLNLSPPRILTNLNNGSPSRSPTASPTSPPSSCVSSETNLQDDQSLKYSSSPEATSMILAGCPRCLMYVMVSEEDPKCPKCKSTVLLDFNNDNNFGGNTSKNNNNVINGDNNNEDSGERKTKKT